jgi:hypothetical protein
LFNQLTEAEKELLSNAQDNSLSTDISSAVLTEYSADKILYTLKDTTDADGGAIQVYEYSTENTGSLYTVSFADVGINNGEYIIVEYAAQGRIYQWVGQGAGNFKPVKKLVAPNKKEMLDIKLDYQAGEYSTVYLESAFSNQDKNLFSDIDRIRGFAFKGGFNLKDKPISIPGGYKLSLITDIELLGKNFHGIDRIRRVEFDRDWSYVQNDSIKSNDLVISSVIGLKKNAANTLSYKVNFRNKESLLSGFQHNLEVNKTLGRIQVNVNGFRMNSTVLYNQAVWNKLYSEVFIKGFVQPGYRYILEQNTMTNGADSIISSANYFSSHEIFIRNNPEKKTKFELAYTTREDKAPYLGELGRSGVSENIRTRFTTVIDNNHRVTAVLNYRTFDNLLTTEDEVESITGRINWTGDVIKKVFRSELNYSIANARVPKREYIFIEVPTGEGTHTWRDENEDGIKDLNEFYEAIHFDERNYIKLYVNGTEFLDAYENLFSYRANLRAPKSWKDKGGVLNLLSRISNITSWTSHYRITDTNLAARFAPFLVNIDHNMVLSMKEALRSTIFINKANPRFGMNIGYASFRKKYLYTNGFESRSDEELNLVARLNISRYYNIKFRSTRAFRENSSDYLEGRNYEIIDYSVGPSVSWQPNPT